MKSQLQSMSVLLGSVQSSNRSSAASCTPEDLCKVLSQGSRQDRGCCVLLIILTDKSMALCRFNTR